MPAIPTSITKMVCATALIVALHTPIVHAETGYNPDKVSVHINIFDAAVSYPAPSWQRSLNPAAEHEMFREQKGPTLLFEMIPKGETFQAWSKILVVAGVRQPNGASMDLGRFASKQLAPFARACGRQNYSVQNLEQTRDVYTVIVYCTASPNGPKQLGYGPDVGEIALLTFRRVKNTFIKVAHEWRGKRFKGEQQHTWPVPYKVLTTMMKRFQRIRVTPSLINK